MMRKCRLWARRENGSGDLNTARMGMRFFWRRLSPAVVACLTVPVNTPSQVAGEVTVTGM